MNILIENTNLLSMEDEIIHKKNIYIKDENISYLGDRNDFPFDLKIDGSNFLTMPGFINSHTHVAMSLFRNYGPETDLMTWLNDYIRPLEDKLCPSDVYYGSKLGILEMIKTGTTCFADMYFFCDETAKACRQMNIRAQISRGLACPDNELNKIKENIEFAKLYKNDPLIDVGLGPHAIYTADLDYLRKISDYAQEYQLPIHIHLSETQKENDDCYAKYKMSPTEVFEKAGIFKNKTIAAHGIYLSDNDLDIIKGNDVSIVHNPSSNLKLSSGFLNLSRLLDRGINVCLGTDSASSNNKLSMLREIETTMLVSKLFSSRPITSFEVLKMATINGAKALGIDRKVGLIKENYKADLIMIDLDNENHIPHNDILSSLCFSTYENDLKNVIINGKLLYQDGKYIGIDDKEILNNSQLVFDKLKAR
ncbi:amidohydrolase family protein [Anaerococcus tetradius]|uniref:Amidohydrolase family protein n=1 Tax=Anaerococcus tetradius TaxID=33036 RepID=A0A133KDH7_9FIRM|nr:amidohydrolase [Anaerococcus tetradius]KWZ77616.1 amidohydrolase family protein [Anaerococcus tetradius]